MRSGLPLALACALSLLAQGCQAAPRELEGLWAGGQGACEAQTGLRFAGDAVVMEVAGVRESLLEAPQYRVSPDGDGLRIEIGYQSPGPGPTVRGEVVLRREADGWLRVIAHRHGDALTGSARARLPDADPLARAMRVRRCGQSAWIEGLRGRPGG